MDFKKRVRDSFAKQQVMKLIGAKLTKVGMGVCEIRMDYNSRLTQQNGFLHAGIVGTIADSACGYAAFSLMDDDASVLSIEFKLNLLAPAKGKYFLAQANVIKSGRTISVCQADVVAIQGRKKVLCATATVTLISLKNYNA